MSGQQKFLTFMLFFFFLWFLSLSHSLGFDFAWVMVGFVVTVVNSVALCGLYVCGLCLSSAWSPA